MIYLKTADESLTMIVLEAGNIAKIMQGKPAKTPDGKVLMAFTTDPVWLADKIMDCDGDAVKIAALIDEGMKRPQKPVDRPYHVEHGRQFPLKGGAAWATFAASAGVRSWPLARPIRPSEMQSRRVRAVRVMSGMHASSM